MDTRVETIVRKNHWQGHDPVKKDFCEHCNQLKWLSKMSAFKQGLCLECHFSKKKLKGE